MNFVIRVVEPAEHEYHVLQLYTGYPFSFMPALRVLGEKAAMGDMKSGSQFVLIPSPYTLSRRRVL